MRIDILPNQILMAIFVVIFAFPVMYAFIGVGNVITIEKPYYDEYQSCETEFNEYKETKCPVVAPCECKESVGGIIYAILGFIIFISGFIFIYFRNKRLDEREEEIRKREKLIEKVKKQ